MTISSLVLYFSLLTGKLDNMTNKKMFQIKILKIYSKIIYYKILKITNILNKNAILFLFLVKFQVK